MKMMVPLLKNVSNSIWHAFHVLSFSDDDIVLKSKLKVLTANIGTLLDLYGVEKGLDHYRSTSELNFEDYKYYLETEVFSSVPSTLSLLESQILEEKIEDVCWFVCCKTYMHRKNPCLDGDSVHKLFRIFCFLGDLVPVSNADRVYQVLMHTNEVGKLAGELTTSVGLDWDCENFESLSAVTESFKFPLFLAFIEGRVGQLVAKEALAEAIDDAYHTLIHDIIKKGTLLKRGYLLPTLREYWFVLRTTQLCYYKSRGESESCGSIPLSPQCRIDAPPNAGKEKFHRIVIYGIDRTIELAAVDHRSRLQWISAIQLAINNSGGSESYQRRQCARRRMQRDAGTLRLREENLRRTSQSLEIQSTKEKLRQEIEAREAADQKARELQSSLEKHEHEARALIDVRNKLEKLLEEEIQAKRDEEIVRGLQARVLSEEWERREELERLQEDQRRLLEEERQKRLAFERMQQLKEEQLKEAEARLRALEMERQSLDLELQNARDKISSSEQSKQVLEAQLRVISPQVKESDRVRRALSFITTSRDRPCIEIRPRIARADDDDDEA